MFFSSVFLFPFSIIVSYFCFFSAFVIFVVFSLFITAVIMFVPMASFSSIFEPIYDPISDPSVKDTIFNGSFPMFITTRLVDITHTSATIPCSIAPSIFFPFDITIILSVDSVFSITLNVNISRYVISFICITSFLLCVLSFILFLFLFYYCVIVFIGDIVRKFFLVGLIFILCGCNIIEESVEDISSTKYGVAKNSVSGYANAVKLAYTDYQYASALGTYEVGDNSTLVNIDGVEVSLNVNYYGEKVSCDVVSIVGGNVLLDNCSVYGYMFKYDGEVQEK